MRKKLTHIFIDKKIVTFSCIFLLLFIFIILSFLFFQFTVDDAYITYRHSFNLINEGNLSWNLTGDRQEAFTNPLFVILGTIGIKFGIKPELPIKIISFFLLFHWLKRTINISKQEKSNKKFFLSTIFIFFIPLYAHAYAGLETLLFSYLLFEYLACKTLGESKDISQSLLMLTCRPEGALFVLMSFSNLILRVFNKSHIPKFNKKNYIWIFFCCITTIFTLSIMIYKFHFFGDLFPNTFYAKSKNETSFYLIIKNLIDSSAWIILFIITFSFGIKNKYNLFKYLGIIFIYLFYLKSNLAMNYFDRFWFQILWPPIIYGISVKSKFLNFKNFKNNSLSLSKIFRNKIYFSNLMGLLYLYLRCAGILTDPVMILTKLDANGRYIKGWAKLGESIDLVLPYDSKIFLGEAGYIPYYAQREIYDLHGLGTKQIAKKGISYEFLENKKIDLFILYATGCNENQTNKKRFPNEINFINNYNYKYVGSIPFRSSLCLNLYSSPEYEKYFYKSVYLNNYDITKTNNQVLKNSIFKNIIYSYKYLFSKEGYIPK